MFVKKHTSYLDKLVITLSVLAVLALIVYGFLPSIARLMRVYAQEKDFAFSQSLNTLLEEHEIDRYGLHTAQDVREALNHASSEPLSFSTHADDIGIFYDRSSHRIESLYFKDVIDTMDDGFFNNTPHNTNQITPELIFGDDLILISTGGSVIANAIQCINQYALESQCYASSGTLFERLSRQMDERFTGVTMQYTSAHELYDMAQFITDLFHPDQTLFVNNQLWHTTADAEAIRTIVFAHNIVTIPSFQIQHFEKGSISLHEVTLPATVNTIESYAFSEVFNIGTLNFSGQSSIRVGLNSLVGIDHVNIDTLEFDRDNPAYEIKATLNGQPLITFNENQSTQAFDLERTRQFFAEKGMNVVSFQIDYFVGDPSRSRVYVYTEIGYYGYIVPQPESD